MSENDHPSLDRMLDVLLDLEREADAELPIRLAAHLAACESCADTARWIRRLRAAIQVGPVLQAPPELVERALDLPRSEPRPRRGTRPTWSLARLVESAFAHPLAAGVRGAAAGRRLLFEVEGGHLDLDVSPAPDDGECVRVVGQVLLNDRLPPDDLMAILWRDRQVVARGSGDAAGVFVFRCVPPGTYGLDMLSLSAGQAVRVGRITLELEQP